MCNLTSTCTRIGGDLSGEGGMNVPGRRQRVRWFSRCRPRILTVSREERIENER